MQCNLLFLIIFAGQKRKLHCKQICHKVNPQNFNIKGLVINRGIWKRKLNFHDVEIKEPQVIIFIAMGRIFEIQKVHLAKNSFLCDRRFNQA